MTRHAIQCKLVDDGTDVVPADLTSLRLEYDRIKEKLDDSIAAKSWLRGRLVKLGSDMVAVFPSDAAVEESSHLQRLIAEYDVESSARFQRSQVRCDHRLISHHVTYHVILHQTIPYISHHIIAYHIIPYHIISCHIISYHITSHHIMSYHIYHRLPAGLLS